jgi:glucose-6-phosphate dehydrogenase assembly protein OpcA
MKRSWWKADASAHRDGTKPQSGPLRRIIDSFISDDPWYNYADQFLDGDTNLTYDEWLERFSGD